jgi:hypothetical protein
VVPGRESTRNFEGPRIYLGDQKEKVTTLTRQDWRGPKAGWTPESLGHWDVKFTQPGKYRFRLTFPPAEEVRKATVRMGDKTAVVEVPAKVNRATLELAGLAVVEGKLEAILEGQKRLGATYVEVEKVD